MKFLFINKFPEYSKDFRWILRARYYKSNSNNGNNNICNIYVLGIQGKCFQFLENLYLSSKACVKINGQFSDSFSILKGVRQRYPLLPILFNLFINDNFNGCLNNSVKIDTEYCCGGLFIDDVVLCASTRSRMNKFLRSIGKWAKDNEMTFEINKCTTLVVRHENSEFIFREDPTFYLIGIAIPKTDCYIYLVIGQVSYYSSLLGSNKNNTKLNIPPLYGRCALAQVKCFNKWKDSN
ncbi:hypothetical protein BCR32DRAFT_285477 [Anaeromyces robustus]|uniref:Reverse transcriptase domain-containing protein n=1 Tax=Anaeromyces robustus TaxID=1754192 RepID=A0A1Y1WNI8_9FUNG|nr:hypothetical protein BCR32DRAFT_285477 [Anaeromyces robustus]|eukprot:ORX75121.1 hypothetical protein BCR32DRAFT_285477 [Anaeromyces robustus]